MSDAVEFGVEYERSDGRRFVAGGYTLAGAAYVAVVREHRDVDPKPVRVMRRVIGWSPAGVQRPGSETHDG